MKVIALTGDSHIGKTTTLNLVYSLLLDRGAIQRNNCFIDLENNDCLDVLETINDQIIGIVTQGDYCKGEYSVKNHLKRLFDYGCDIVICAANKGKTNIKKAICGYEDHIFIDKTVSQSVENRRVNNYKDAMAILNRVIQQTSN